MNYTSIVQSNIKEKKNIFLYPLTHLRIIWNNLFFMQDQKPASFLCCLSTPPMLELSWVLELFLEQILFFILEVQKLPENLDYYDEWTTSLPLSGCSTLDTTYCCMTGI